MLFARDENMRAVRFSMPDSLDSYMRGSHKGKTTVSATAFLQEAFFLGLRLNQGVDTQELRHEFGNAAMDAHGEAIADLVELKLLQSEEERIFLTPRGRLLSNEVFQRFLSASDACESSR
jgi:oxygen-independent coproporphyrinogen-3 oxidase